MKTETLEAIKEIQEWQAANKSEEKYTPKVSIEEEAKLMEQKYIDLICSLLTKNIDAWEFKDYITTSISIKKYLITVRSYGIGYSSFRINIEDECVFEYDLRFGTKPYKIAKKAVRNVSYLHNLRILQVQNKLLAMNYSELEGAI
jgi:hypothetical protein